MWGFKINAGVESECRGQRLNRTKLFGEKVKKTKKRKERRKNIVWSVCQSRPHLERNICHSEYFMKSTQ